LKRQYEFYSNEQHFNSHKKILKVMSSQKKRTLIDHLKEQIKKSGYPLEIEISSILDKNWEVMNTDSYYDNDAGKMRDIDINAIREITHKYTPFPLMTFVNLTIECKRNENFAWVFFTRPYKYSFEDIDGQYIDGLQILTQNIENMELMELILHESKLHYSRIRKVAPCYDEVFIEGKKERYQHKKDEIFEAVNQLKKYIIYSNEQALKTTLPYVINIYFPCIVFDGKMFEAKVSKEDVTLRRIKHVVLVSSHRTSYSTWDLGFLVDIVHKDHFNTFLKSIENDFKNLSLVIEKNGYEIFEELTKTESLIKRRKKVG